MDTNMDQPIACSLDAAAAGTQLDEWRAALSAAVTSIERPDAQTVRIGLGPVADDLASLVGLARREVACCPFFRFAFEIDEQGTALRVSVPLEAASMLDGFIELTTA